MPLKATSNLIYSSCLTASKEGDYIRLVYSPASRESGWESTNESDKVIKDNCTDSERFEESISRTKSLVRQYARCNSWEYFLTFTVSQDKWDRFNLREFYGAYSKMVNNLNYRRRDGEKLSYVIIPEQHKNGAWHMHGILNGIPKDDLSVNEHGYLDWKRYSERFGYCSISKIRDMDACSLYITKYVTKDMFKSPLKKGEHIVMASHGLKKAEKLFSKRSYDADAFLESVTWDWSSDDGVRIKTIKKGSEEYELFVHWAS